MRSAFVRGWAAALTASAIVAFAIPAVQSARAFFVGKNNNTVLINRYAAIEGYLRAETPDGTTIAMPEPGAFGFRLGPKFRVFDVLGLITPDVIPAMLSGNFNYVVPHLKPEYVIVSWGGAYEPNAYAGFDDKYQLVAEFNTRYWVSVLKHGALLYKRRSAGNWLESQSKLDVVNLKWPYGAEASFSLASRSFGAESADNDSCGKFDYDAIVSQAGGGAIGGSPDTIKAAGWAHGKDGEPVGSTFLLLRGHNGSTYMARFAHRSVVGDIDRLDSSGVDSRGSVFWGRFNKQLVVPGSYRVSYLYYSHGALVECRLRDVIQVSASD